MSDVAAMRLVVFSVNVDAAPLIVISVLGPTFVTAYA
jgi:hypothetical protein